MSFIKNTYHQAVNGTRHLGKMSLFLINVASSIPRRKSRAIKLFCRPTTLALRPSVSSCLARYLWVAYSPSKAITFSACLLRLTNWVNLLRSAYFENSDQSLPHYYLSVDQAVQCFRGWYHETHRSNQCPQA